MTARVPLVMVVFTGLVVACSDKRTSDLELRVTKLEGDVAGLKAAASASASAPDPKKECAHAKLACADAWSKGLPGAEAARKLAGAYTTGPADRFAGWHHPELYDLPKAAYDACVSGGGIKIRDTARAVKDALDRSEIADAKKASEVAFDACKDVDP